jgi:hypothetical protein
MEHLLLRKLRRNGPQFFWEARIQKEWMVFRCFHLPQRLSGVFHAMRTLFLPLSPEAQEIEQELRILRYEKLVRKHASYPAEQNLLPHLHELYKQYFVPHRICVVVHSPYPPQTVLQYTQNLFPSTAERQASLTNKQGDSLIFPKEIAGPLIYLRAKKQITPAPEDIYGCLMLSVYISSMLYQKLIVPGYTYQASAYYDDTNNTLEVWVATTPQELWEMKKHINSIFSELCDSSMTPLFFSILQERTQLYYFMERQSGLQLRERNHFSLEDFLRIRQKYLSPTPPWSFYEKSCNGSPDAKHF